MTSLQNTEPLPTFTNFGKDVCFVADTRGFEAVVHHVGKQCLTYKNGVVNDPRVLLNKVSLLFPTTLLCYKYLPKYLYMCFDLMTSKHGLQVVVEIRHSPSGVIVRTEDGAIYQSRFAMVSVSVGVLQTKLIDFVPNLPVRSYPHLHVTYDNKLIYSAYFHLTSNLFIRNGSSLPYISLIWLFTPKYLSSFQRFFGLLAMEQSFSSIPMKRGVIILSGR